MKNIIMSETGIKSLFLVSALMVLVSLGLAACGGGGSDSGSAATYAISGQVLSGGIGLAGVAITPSAGTAVNTDGSGNYTISGLANGTYTITPSKTGYTFTPPSSSKTVSSANITNVDFTAVSTSSVQVVDCATAVTTTSVTIQNFSFSPAAVTISVNDIVKWTNAAASTTHTVTSGSSTGTTGTPDGKFDSGSITPSQTYCLKFTTSGSYPYFCTPHPSMIGAITVQ